MAGFEYVLNQDARILFVDDDPILREFAQVNLSSPTVSVDLASNGSEAWTSLRPAITTPCFSIWKCPF